MASGWLILNGLPKGAANSGSRRWKPAPPTAGWGAKALLKTAGATAFPAFSPDGRWLAYTDAQAGGMKCTCAPFRTFARRCRFPTPAESSRYGPGLNVSCSIGRKTSKLWRRAANMRPTAETHFTDPSFRTARYTSEAQVDYGIGPPRTLASHATTWGLEWIYAERTRRR